MNVNSWYQTKYAIGNHFLGNLEMSGNLIFGLCCNLRLSFCWESAHNLLAVKHQKVE